MTQFIFYHSEDSLDLSGRRFLLMLLVSTSLNLSSVPNSKDGPIINGCKGATKKGTRGALGPPNKEQNWENKEQNGGKKFQNGAFLGYGNS